jgi:tungstate transport system substrate-binding protein
VVLVHARAREDAFVEEGNGTQRYDVMYNDFVIVGPADDPAGIAGMTDAAAAFAAIADAEAPFVSRGDDSGTHTKEKAIWEAAGITPEGDWYISAGQGMGAVLTMSDELAAYTLSDRATYLAMQAEGLGLDILVEGDPILFNPYGVIPVNPEKHPDVNAELAQQFVDWLVSLETQELIASFEVNGQQLFTPDSEAWRAAQATPTGEPGRLILATTTSTEDSGLLDYILPDFEEKYNAEVDVVAVGTGQALELGANGDADVVLVHARAREDAFVEEGNGTQRYDVMYNDFVIVSPADDPAGIAGMTDAAAAFAAIADAEAPFVSRGDDSGTHTKEKAIWEAAGITPEGDWYISAGQGMGAVLTMSDELAAYTLADRATYLAMQAEGLGLDILVEGDPILFNPYGVIPVNPEKHPDVNAELAQQFVDWLVSLETQELIASFEVNGQQLFTPDSEAWRATHGE